MVLDLNKQVYKDTSVRFINNALGNSKENEEQDFTIRGMIL